MKSFTVFFMMVILFPLHMFSQEPGDRVTLLLNNGYSVTGTLVRNDPEQAVVIRVASGEELAYEREMIVNITKGNGGRISGGAGKGSSMANIDFENGSGGVILSLNRSGLSKFFRDQENKEGFTNISLAFFGIMPIQEKISVQAELTIESKGFKMDEEYVSDGYSGYYYYYDYEDEAYNTTKYRETLLDIPVMINYEVYANPKISLLAGPSLALKISDNYNGFLGKLAIEPGLQLGTQLEYPVNENFNFIGRIKYENSFFRHGKRFNGLAFGVGVSMNLNRLSSVLPK